MPTPMQSPSLVNALSHRMDYLVERQGIISGNIANASTPGFLARDLSFRRLVESKPGLAVQQTNPNHLHGSVNSSARGVLTEDDTHVRHDGNSIKLDEQFLKMNEIQLGYTAVTRIYQKQKELQLSVVRR